MASLRPTIIPKSDQMNADDLIGVGVSRTIKITRVVVTENTEQPVSIHFDGDGGKPYKPGKSMRKILVAMWGDEGDDYVGRSLTLFRDAAVTWGGEAVGGIRISHASHIGSDFVMALTATKKSRKPFVVKPMPKTTPAPKPTRSPPAATATTAAPAGPEEGEAAPQPAQEPAAAPAGTMPDLLQARVDRALERLREITTAPELAAFKSSVQKLLTDLDAGGFGAVKTTIETAITAATPKEAA